MKREVSPAVIAAAVVAVLAVVLIAYRFSGGGGGKVVHIGKGESFDMKTGKVVPANADGGARPSR